MYRRSVDGRTQSSGSITSCMTMLAAGLTMAKLEQHSHARYRYAVFRTHDILDPCLWLMDPDPDPGSCFFRHWPSRCQQKTIFVQTFFLLITVRRYIYIIFQIWKSQKESQNSRNQGFSYYFCMMTEGSGSIPKTNGSGSGRPKDPVDPDPEHCRYVKICTRHTWHISVVMWLRKGRL